MTSDRAREPLSGRSVLITGGAGFIGARVGTRLAETFQCNVVAIDDLRTGDWTRVSSSVERLEADITTLTRPDWFDLAGGHQYVIHLAAEKYNTPGSTTERIIETNIAATSRLFEAAASLQNPPRVVFTSTLYAYGSLGPAAMSETDPLEPWTTYGASKAAGEYLLRSAAHGTSMGWNIARLFFIYGPRQYASGGYKSVIISNFERIAAGKPPLVKGSGDQVLDYVFVEDCVDALIEMATSPVVGTVANISSGSGVSINSLTSTMLDISGHVGLKPEFAPADWTEGSSRIGEAKTAESLFGWKANTPLRTGLAKTWKWVEGD